MKQIFKIATYALIGGAVLTGCKKEEGCTNPLATNYNPDAEDDDGSCILPTEDPADPAVVTPATYVFQDGNGNNTVSFSGQAARLGMLSEITVLMKTTNTPGNSVSATDLKNMYANNGYTWTDAGNDGLNSSTKQLKNKTAASTGTADPAIQAIFEGYMDDMATISAATVAGQFDGGPGVAGVVQNSAGTKQYLHDANGFEYTQLIEKGLMGAVFLDQITNWYLGDARMNVDNSTAVDPANGKYYTVMEHHWDEAFGYFTTAIDYPASGTNRFWGNYSNGRESVLGTATKLSEAFRKGRAAIAAGNMTVRDEQRAIIRAELIKVCGGTGIHYINEAIADFADDAIRNHVLSEAHAFINDLKYAHNGPSASDVDAILNILGNDFYNVTLADLNMAKDQLAALVNLESVKDQL